MPSELPLAYSLVSICVRPINVLVVLPWTGEVQTALRVQEFEATDEMI